MQSTTKINRGDIILVEVAFSNGLGKKLRPALVISTNAYNKARDEVIISGITSNVNRLHKGDTKIVDWEKAGLKVPSHATAVIQTVKKDRIQKSLGQIENSDVEKIEVNLSQVLGFSMLSE